MKRSVATALLTLTVLGILFVLLGFEEVSNLSSLLNSVIGDEKEQTHEKQRQVYNHTSTNLTSSSANLTLSSTGTSSNSTNATTNTNTSTNTSANSSHAETEDTPKFLTLSQATKEEPHVPETAAPEPEESVGPQPEEPVPEQAESAPQSSAPEPEQSAAVPEKASEASELSVAVPVQTPDPQPSDSSALLQVQEVHVPQETQIVERPKLWIHVLRWGEGIASWKITFKEILAMAKYTDAVVVEPCIGGGRLISCRQYIDPNSAQIMNMTITMKPETIRFGDVYDLDRVRAVYPHVASYEEFAHATGYRYNATTGRLDNSVELQQNTFHACLARSGCRPGEPQTTYRKNKQVEIDKAAKNARKKRKVTVLEIHYQERDSMRRWRVPNVPGKNPPLISDSLGGIQPEQLLRFHKRHYDQVDYMLHNSLNISQGAPYAAFQWRPERMKEDYIPCAQAILNARDTISKQDNIPKDQFVLISPLSLVPSLQWGPLAKEADQSPNTSYPSLQLLLDAGFKKLEQSATFTDAIPDEVYLVIYDFILAEKAQTFTTCSDCSGNDYCSRCNWQGRASKYAISLRQEATRGRGKINTCWPTTGPQQQQQQQRRLHNIMEETTSLLW
ncbi:expressed unknown protein [Seminavis robusta]|uniref:Uncharacterized protein n=1 Tax=Seminavis robusta TaxID=568900 RepID=A0A9N8EJL4_9STRA|nr:expressed unknown protein [Seminavis robusta]|eukprot:Sro1287_g259490.1 n/a (617) ;mRNA; f:23581-25431